MKKINLFNPIKNLTRHGNLTEEEKKEFKELFLEKEYWNEEKESQYKKNYPFRREIDIKFNQFLDFQSAKKSKEETFSSIKTSFVVMALSLICVGIYVLYQKLLI